MSARQGKWACIVMLSGLAGASLSHAALAPPPASPQTSAAASTETEEIVVRGTPLYELRAAVIAAEERFYARYNELNKVKDFDIECTVSAPTGTRLKQRTCRTILQLNAQSEQAAEFVQIMQEQAALQFGSPTGKSPTIDPDTVFLGRYKEYKENVLYLLKMNPDLRRLVHEREEAAKRYDSERRRRFREQWFAF